MVIDRPEFTHGRFIDVPFLSALARRQSTSEAVSDLALVKQLCLAFFDDVLKSNHDPLGVVLKPPASGVRIDRIH